MKQLLTILILCALINTSKAQHYFPFLRSNISYFEGQNSKVYTLKIKDSSNNQYNFEPNLHINPNFDEGTCEIKTNASWMGRKVVQVSDTSFWFINFEGKPITLYTNSKVGQSWEAYVNGVIPIMFNHLKDSTLQIFGATDSIKIIQTTLPAQSNTTQLVDVWLSKKHGLIKTVNFYTFPKTFQLGILTYQFPSTLTLISEANTNLPLQNITWSDIYNFDVGDEFHYLDYDYTSLYSRSNNRRTTNADTCRSIYIVYNKQITNDSFLYSFIRRKYCTFKNDSNQSASLVTDSFDAIYNRDTLLDRQPGIAYPNKYGNFDDVYTLALKLNTTEKYTYLRDVFFDEGDTCANIAPDMYSTPRYYYKGCGGPYYETSFKDFLDEGSSAHQLVYYKKSNQTWGNPWPQNVSLSKTQQQHTFAIYPNPAKNWLFVNNPNTLIFGFKLLNVWGEVVFETIINTGENNLNISELKRGIYFYHLQNEEQVETGKLVID
ncbi:MAG: T9SS type A sorting domain-containing protein [Bacteroidia bacterium]